MLLGSRLGRRLSSDSVGWGAWRRHYWRPWQEASWGVGISPSLGRWGGLLWCIRRRTACWACQPYPGGQCLYAHLQLEYPLHTCPSSFLWGTSTILCCCRHCSPRTSCSDNPNGPSWGSSGPSCAASWSWPSLCPCCSFWLGCRLDVSA